MEGGPTQLQVEEEVVAVDMMTVIGRGMTGGMIMRVEGVVVDTTAISLVDGEAGVLSYRGVPIDDLVDAPFGEVAALVVDDQRSDRLAKEVSAHAELSPRERELVLSLPADTHPMHVLQVELLRRWREGGREDKGLLDVLKATVNGIALGIQNTG